MALILLRMVVSMIALFVACSVPVRAVDPEVARRLIPFVHEGAGRADLVDRLGGRPAFTTETGRVVVYWMALQYGYLKVMPSPGSSEYELVLVFNAEDRLARYSVLRTR